MNFNKKGEMLCKTSECGNPALSDNTICENCKNTGICAECGHHKNSHNNKRGLCQMPTTVYCGKCYCARYVKNSFRRPNLSKSEISEYFERDILNGTF